MTVEIKVNKNEELIAEAMSGGMLNQAFILSALAEYSKSVIASPIPEDDIVRIVDPREWKKTAVSIREILIKYGYYQEGK
jgi:hypothetical protein